MADNLFSFEPGSLPQADVVNLLADRLAEKVVQSFPPSWQAGLALSQIATDAIGIIGAAAVSGPAAVAVAVVEVFKSINQSLNEWANQTKENIGSEWVKSLEDLSFALINSANGRILTTYQPANKIEWKRAQAYTATWKKDGITTLEGLKGQFRKGYVVGVKRPLSSDYIAATVPVLVFTGCPLGGIPPESIYSDNPMGYMKAPYPEGMCRGGLGWGDDNTWRWAGLADYSDVNATAGFKWTLTAAELANAHGCPPLRAKIAVAPGLAPTWGPYGNDLPITKQLAAYAAAMLGKPPPDLDQVANYLAVAGQLYGRKYEYTTPILDILWAREDLARRGEQNLKPRGDAWAGPFWQAVGLPEPSAQKGNGGGKFPGMFEGKKLADKPSGGGGGGGGGLLLVAAGAAGLVLLTRRGKR